jgi:hypothetical protein
MRIILYIFSLSMVSTIAFAAESNNTKDNGFIIIPSITVQVTLSKKAELKMNELKELASVGVIFHGDPTPDAPLSEDGTFYIGEGIMEKKVNASGIVTFEGIKISAKELKFLSNRNYYVDINTFNNGDSSNLHLNMLNCDTVGGSINEIKQKILSTSCKLLDGE